MSLWSRYLVLAFLGSRLALAAQTAEAETDKSAPVTTVETVGTATVTDAVPDPPPEEPQEAPSKKKPRKQKTLAPAFHESHRNALFGQNVIVRKGETIEELVLIGGSADIQGEVEREVVVIGGTLKVSGRVGGDLVAIGSALNCAGTVHRHVTVVLGRADLANTARLERGGFFLGGPFKIAPDATIIGERLLIPIGDVLPKINGLKDWLTNGLLWGRLLPIGVHWAWVVAGFFVALYFLALILFPAAVKAIFVALEDRPVTSIFSGFLTLILLGPLVAILLASVVGIPVVPFVQVTLVLAILFGKTGVMCFLGRSFGRSTGAAFLQVPLAAFLIGATLLVLAYMIPIFGVLAWGLATVFGLGGAVVALASMFKREQAAIPPAPVTIRSGPTAAMGFAAPPLVHTTSSGQTDTLLLPRAGFWKRLLASFLDLLLLGALVPVVGKGFLPCAVFYFVAMWAWKGSTVGSILLRLRVVRTDGTPVTLPVALVRSLSSLFSGMVLFLGFLWCGWDREKQSWHDKIAGTVVVQMPRAHALV